jgi:glucoamylase
VAGLCSPWGAQKNDPGGYHLVWPRDAVEVALGFVALGRPDDAAALLAYLVSRQAENGSWAQNFYPDGTAYWGGLQLDEVALPILLAAKLDEAGRAPAPGTVAAIAAAVEFLVVHGPLTDQDRWEEDPGVSPYTVGIIIAALLAATRYVGPEDAAYLAELADDWNERVEEWSYVHGSYLDALYGIAGHYVRIGALSVTISNQADRHFAVPYQGVVGLEFMYLARLGLRAADDPRMTDTLVLVEAFLRRDVGTGVAYYRYDFDGYGEQPDGSDFDGAHGIGRPWPLLAGERGHLAALRGERWQDQLAAMLAMRSDSGLVPEQVWDLAPLGPGNGGASQPLLTGRPTLSATPLVWGHSELVKLALTGPAAAPVERLRIVAEHFAGDRAPAVAHWRTTIPVVELPSGRDLAVEDTQPFTLHFGHDGWQDATDRDSAPGRFGLHGVTLTGAETAGWGTVDFKRRYAGGWEAGDDHHVAIVAAAHPRLRGHSGVRPPDRAPRR